MLFVLLASHTAETCPTSNSKTRELMMKGVTELPNLASRLGVKFVAGPLVNREHLVVAVVEAAKVESVDQFIFESGIEQWNSVRIIPSLTLEEGLKELNKVKTIF